MANPAKAGDAKPWVCRRSLYRHDCQVAEEGLKFLNV